MSISISEVRKKIFINSGLIVAGRFIGTISSLLIVPMNIRKLGIEGYGYWGAIWAGATFFSVLNLALSSTMLWQSSTVEGEKISNEEFVSRLRRKAGVGVFFAAIQFLLCGAAALLLLDLLLDKFGLEVSQVNRICLGGSILLVLFSGYSEIAGAMLSGQNHSGVVSNVRSFSALIGNAAIFILLVCGLGMLSLPLGFAVNYLCFSAALCYLTWKKMGIWFFHPVFPRLSELKEMTGYTVCSLVGRVTAAVRTQFTCIALGNQVSFEWAGYYTVATKIGALLLEVNSFFMVPMIAFVNRLKREQGALFVIYRDMVVAAAVVSGLVCAGITAVGSDFLSLWLNSPNLKILLPMIFILLLQYMIALIVTGQGVAVCQGDGKNHFETAYLLLNLVLNILLLWLTRPMGGWGILLSAAVSWIFAGCWFSLFIQHHYHLPSVFPICLKTVSVTLALMGGALWMLWNGEALFVNHWVGLIVKGILGPLLFLAVLLPGLRLIPLETQKKYLIRTVGKVREAWREKVAS